MRPLKSRRDHLLRPLNEILGTQANVRLLRAVSLSATSLTSGELATRAKLGRTSIYPALRELERVGIIEFVGAGAQRQIQLRERHPLARSLRELFRAEVRRFEELVAALRDMVVKLPLRPISAWTDERADDSQDDEETLRLHLVARPEDLDKLADHLNSRLARVERAYDVHIAVQGFTRSEVEALYRNHRNTLSNAVLLDGVPPVALLEASRPLATAPGLKSHDEHDARSRRLALAIATKIKRDPGLVRVVEDRIKRRAPKASPGERRELAEWMRAFSTMSAARLRRFLLEDSERGIRLRQSLPALNLLSPAEREAVIQSRTDRDVIAAVSRR